MYAGALKALEFDRIVRAVGRLALTPLGAARLADLRPHTTDVRRVEAALAATAECVRYLDGHGDVPLDGGGEIEPTIANLAVQGRALEPMALLDLARFLTSVEQARGSIRRAGPRFPILLGLVDGAGRFEAEVADIRRKIEPSGDLADDASPELKAIRDRLRKQRQRLRSTLESYLRGRDTARYLQDQIITERNGRFVLAVRAEHRHAIPGIVHGSSASGASLFLEPLSTVEVNNEIVALGEQEAVEERRVLLRLSDAFRNRALDLTRTVDVATELDALQARARFARLIDGVEPVLSNDGRLDLRAARHPLLIPGVASMADGDDDRSATRPGSGPVPVDLCLTPPAAVLVITGPNTGGKTVALKTAGLLAVMAQSGLLVPAAPGCRLPVFQSIFADIGDEQSIAASLSTFSAHVTNIAGMDRALTLPALVLLDEIGAGTDPAEGGALGMAIIEHFRCRGALVMATTHYDVLKSYASTTPGVMCAAFGFDPATYTPTYALSYGTPGRSLALEVAEHLGLPASIIQAAREFRNVREAQLAEHLARIDRDLQALEHEKRLTARERTMLAEAESQLRLREESHRRREEALRRRVEEELDDRLREARREIDHILADLKRRTAALAVQAGKEGGPHRPAAPTGEAGAVRATARAALDALEGRLHEGLPRPPSTPQGPAPGPPAVGARAAIERLGVEGVVISVHDREAEVEVRGKRLRVPVEQLRVVATAAAAPPRASVTYQTGSHDGPLGDLNVIGCTVDEALARTEKFLDSALLTEHRTVRVIHGHGTGQLRRAIAELLSGHPLVERYSPASSEQGGGGVTVVELKD